MSRKKKEAYLNYLKKLIIILIILAVIVVIIAGGLHKLTKTKKGTEEQSKEEIVKLKPPVHELNKVWVEGNDEDIITIRYKNRSIKLQKNNVNFEDRQILADVVMSEGKVISITPFTKKINGKLLSIQSGFIELEGKGRFSYDTDLQVYKLYGDLEEYSIENLKIGYDFTDFVLDGETIIGALVTREEKMENIRVLIKTTDFGNSCHEEVSFSVDTSFVLRSGEQEKEYSAGEKVSLTVDSPLFISDRIIVEPAALTAKTTLDSVGRSQGVPSYRGKLEIEKTEAGLVVVNELLLEEYLYSVVPSEMPSSYPIEALKAQAVCARTYAYRHMLKSSLKEYGAHVDDSTVFQVYNNIIESDTALQAVRETSGQLAVLGEEPVDTYFYSTSCGYGTDMGAWKESISASEEYLAAKHINSKEVLSTMSQEDFLLQESTPEQREQAFAAFISSTDSSDFEQKEGWYRWNYETELNEELLLEKLKTRYQMRPKQVLTKTKNGKFVSKEIKKLGTVKNITVLKRSSGGVIKELLIEGTKKTYKIISENNARYILANEADKVLRQTGDQVAINGMLPSAFAVIEVIMDEDDNVVQYHVKGGGFGHGIGMSQNGARAMADGGYTYEQIVSFFYNGVTVRQESE